MKTRKPPRLPALSLSNLSAPLRRHFGVEYARRAPLQCPAPCFHPLPNPFPANTRVFTLMRTPRGVYPSFSQKISRFAPGWTARACACQAPRPGLRWGASSHYELLPARSSVRRDEMRCPGFYIRSDTGFLFRTDSGRSTEELFIDPGFTNSRHETAGGFIGVIIINPSGEDS